MTLHVTVACLSAITDRLELLQFVHCHAVVPLLVCPHLLHTRKTKGAAALVPVGGAGEETREGGG